ncbi:MAG: ATP-binding protein [Pseudomonadota bacterium]
MRAGYRRGIALSAGIAAAQAAEAALRQAQDAAFGMPAAALPWLLGAASVGALIALAAVVVAQRLRGAREIATMRRMLTASADWWWRTDAALAVVEVEPGRRLSASVELQRLLGRKPWQLADAADAPKALAEAVDARAPFYDVLVRVPGASAARTIALSGTPLFSGSGRFAGYAGVARDLTETLAAARGPSREQAAEIERLRAELEACNRQGAERARAFEFAVKELDSFAHSVSHDLRAPLRVVEGFANIVLEDYGERLDDLGREHLKRIVTAGQRMNSMIDTLLALSRTTSREIERERVDLSRLARELADELRAQDAGRDVRFVVADGQVADGDRTLLRLVLQNLLGNAYKFTAKVAAARVEFGARDDGGQTVYYVRDNGAGFDMRFADKLFGLFQRFHSANEFPGTGVGLATVQRIVRKHGGRIWAESKPGEGATFFFTLWERR